jgi:hypothetical protein
MAPPPAAPARADSGLAQRSSPARSRELVHGLGFSGSFSYGSGFTYRRHFGTSSLQISGFGWVANRGDDALVFGGLAYAQRLYVWSGAANRILPATSALRFVASATWFQYRQQFTDVTFASECNAQGCITRDTSTQRVDSTKLFGVGAGIGFEFGAIQQPGFSVTLDLLLTAAFDRVGVPKFILPLPAGSLVYNW